MAGGGEQLERVHRWLVANRGSVAAFLHAKGVPRDRLPDVFGEGLERLVEIGFDPDHAGATTFACRTLGNVAMEIERWRRHEIPEADPPEGASFSAPAERVALRECLGELSDPDVLLVTMMGVEGYSAREAGARLGLAEETAQKRYSRARERLRRCLGGDDDRG
jgi:RNA polymerase sigma factor (sigma-70 family)